MDITVEGLTLKYGNSVAVKDLDLYIAEGEALVLLGQSGCGKTSTMRCIAGLEKPAAGRIKVGNRTLFDSSTGEDVPSHKRNIGMVFQSYAIWPHLTVAENVGFPLRMQKVNKQEGSKRIADALELVGLAGFADRGASMLSGGQMQRVALARSLVMQPSVMLLDEPLSNLDARLRQRLRGDLRELQTRLGLTSIYVTHDQEEALALADRIAMMQFGRIVQIGTPSEIYSAPLSASIADFLGVGNIFQVQEVGDSQVKISDGIALHTQKFHPGTDLKACIRAEDILIGESVASRTGINKLSGELVTREFQGATAYYRVRLAGDVEISVLGSKHMPVAAQPGDLVEIGIPVEAVQVLPHDVPGVHTDENAPVPPSTRLIGTV